ncbi:hypothetical protein [Endozoicomonas sp. ALE010]|uniref:hypothetical protein n=1 Tax=Endozoicomonas sp. ALE010 TaxID=3403081 RepID=UPI003BB7768D
MFSPVNFYQINLTLKSDKKWPGQQLCPGHGRLHGRLSGWFSQPAIMALDVCLLIIGSGLMLTSDIGWIITGFLVNAFGFIVAHSNASSWE